MQVILIKDVKGLGRANEAVMMTDGYALNFLIPKKLAIPATLSALKHAALRKKQNTDRHEIDTALLAQNIASLAQAHLTITKKANEKGHLYDAVDATALSAIAKDQAHIDLPEDSIKLERPIKEIGVFDVPVAIGEVFGKFSITIEAE